MYIGNDLQIAHPSYKIIDDISSGFNGSTTSFALQVNGAAPVPFPISTQQVMISVNGVVQEPDPTGSAGFKLLGSNIVFSSAPANGHAFFGVINAGADYVTAGSEFPDGSATAPSFTFQDDQDTGWFRSGSGAVGYSANGVQTLTFDGNGLTVTGDASFVGDSAKNLLWDKSDGQFEFADNAKAVFGAGSDFSIYHDGSGSYLQGNSGGSGNVYLDANGSKGIYIRSGDGASGVHQAVTCINNAQVELYYDNSKKFATVNTGVEVFGDIFGSGKVDLPDNGKLMLGTGDDLQIYHDGSNSNIKNSTGWLNLSAGGNGFSIGNGDFSENIAKFSVNGSVDLYYDNSKKFETVSWGARVTGTFEASTDIQVTDAGKFNVGSSNDLQIYHDGTDSIIKAAGSATPIKIQGYSSNTSTVHISARADKETIKCLNNSNAPYVELYYDNSKKIETTSSGVTVSGTVSDSKGNLRSIPQNNQGGAYTLVAADAGKHILAGGNVTIPNSIWTAGDAVTIINTTSGDITLTANLGALINSADAATGNRTLATKGMATILFVSATGAYISGAGLS